ncbi:arsenic transporter [Kurthia gibsonii]|uniref:arsenic transporter n=1 Tax=Kurthia gibsonii TaxID=33946 RepID=UPI0034CF2554
MFDFWIALLLFIVTLFFVIVQPRNIGIGWSACAGAAIAFLLGIVNMEDFKSVVGITWNATLAFIGIIMISIILDEIGVFEWSARHMAKLARGHGIRMYVYICLLGAVVAAFFANDGAALILTPIVLAMVRNLNFKEKMIFPFIIASGFIADMTSLPFVISNLVNIVAADYFSIGFAEYALHMIIPNLFSLLATIIILLWYFKKAIPRTYDATQISEPKDAIRHQSLFKQSWWMSLLLLIGYFSSEWTGIPVSFIVLAVAFIMLVQMKMYRFSSPTKVIKMAPWNIVFFSIGMYLVVYGLGSAGMTHGVAIWIQWLADQGLFVATIGMGFLSAILSAIMNNLPTVMIQSLAIQEVNTTPVIRDTLIYANVIGSDLGPKMTPIGSLATLVWLHVLSLKGIQISWIRYIKIGFICTIPILLVTLLGLYITMKLF